MRWALFVMCYLLLAWCTPSVVFCQTVRLDPVQQEVASTERDVTTVGKSHSEHRMVRIHGGTYTIGTNDPTAPNRERPAKTVTLNSFWIDLHEVTNAQFAAHVQATGYVTVAERPID